MGIRALEEFEFFLELRRLHLFQIFFNALQAFFNLSQIADHQIEFDILDVAQRINFSYVRDGRIVEHPDHVSQSINLPQMPDVAAFFERVLADGPDVHIFDGGMRQFLGIVERSQLVETLVGNFGERSNNDSFNFLGNTRI